VAAALCAAYPARAGLEAEARFIGGFRLGLMPGLLQTRDYAHAVLEVTVPHRNREAG